MRGLANAFLVCLLGTLGAGVAARQQAAIAWPDTPAGTHARAYIEAFNSGTDEAFAAFVTQHIAAEALKARPLSARLDAFHQLREQMGVMTPQRIVSSTAQGLEVEVATARGGQLTLAFELEAAAPYRLNGVQLLQMGGGPSGGRGGPGGAAGTGLVFRGGPPPGPIAHRPAVIAAGLDGRVDAYLAEFVSSGFSGSILVARGNEVLYSKGFGLADRTSGRKVDSATVFYIGSIGKQFTGAAIMKLVEQGRLALTDTIGRFLPRVPADKSAITIEQLLAHRSGIAATTGPIKGAGMESRDARVAFLLAAPLASPPGTAYEYSNSGYNLLAAIIEYASGTAYQKYLYDNLLKPAGMSATGFRMPINGVPPVDPSRVAHVYSRDGQEETPLGDAAFSWFFTGPGDILTTTGDLHNWAEALRAGRVLSPRTLAMWQSPSDPDGYGWGLRDSRYGLMSAHSGGTTVGTGAHLIRYPDSGVTIAFCLNANGMDYLGRMSRSISDFVFGQ